MVLLQSWPSITDDSGNKTSGTIINLSLFDAIKASVEDQVHSNTNTLVKPKTITDEVIAARGSLANLDARLDVEHNEDGTHKSAGSRRLNADFVSRGNSGVAETDLSSYTVPASTFTADNQFIRVTVAGLLANNGNTKTLRIYWAGTATTIFAVTTANTVFFADIGIGRFTSTNARLYGTVTYGANLAVTFGASAIATTWSNTNIVKTTGQSSAASNDIFQHVFTVEFMP